MLRGDSVERCTKRADEKGDALFCAIDFSPAPPQSASQSVCFTFAEGDGEGWYDDDDGYIARR